MRLVVCTLFLASGLGLVSPTPALADLVDYTFTGTVVDVQQAYLGYSVGDAVTYTFAVDFARGGTETEYSGTTIDYGSVYFYAEYLSGNIAVDSHYYNASNDGGGIASYNLGYVWYLEGGSTNSTLQVYSASDTPVSAWNAGDTLYGYNFGWDSQGRGGQISSALTLTAITPEQPLGEPDVTFELLSLGLTACLSCRLVLRGAQG